MEDNLEVHLDLAGKKWKAKMNFYIMKNKAMPWGDYGDTLCYGYLKQMDDNYQNMLESPELERAGPYIPKLYIANSICVMAVDNVKDFLQTSNIKGVKRYAKTIKKRIVKIKWTEWLSNESPEFYPKSGEPEDYIYGRPHDEGLAESMPEVHCLEIEERYTIKKLSDVEDYECYTDLALEGNIALDIFCPTNMWYVIVSEKFKTLTEQVGVDSVEFIKIQKSEQG